MSMGENLSPCPFCGGEAHVYLAGDGPAERSVWKYNIGCDHLPECPISTSGGVVGDLDACSDDLDKLTEAWNRRADEPQRRARRVCRDDAGVPQSFLCSECGWFDTDVDGLPLDYSYCPNCGARVTRGDGE